MTHTAVRSRGWLGNPYRAEDYGRSGAVARFREDFEARLEADPDFRAAVRDIAGARLGCWCQTLEDDQPACHGEVIAEWADKLAAADTREDLFA